jgi:uncharacterized protein YqgC (DUF456 family)
MIFTRILKIILGLILVFTGIIGLLVPVMPGWLLIFPGLAMLFPEKGKEIATKLKKRVQGVSRYFE